MLGHIRPEARKLGLPVRVIRRDAVPRCGPLGGIHTALQTTRADAVLFLACDMPFVTSELLSVLCNRFADHEHGLFVETKGKSGFPFILRQESRAIVSRQIGRGELSLGRLAAAAKAGAFLPKRAWQSQLLNVNTPKEWEQAQRRLSLRTPANRRGLSWIAAGGARPCRRPAAALSIRCG